MYKRKVKVGKLKLLKWYQIINIWKIFNRTKKEKLRNLIIDRICFMKYENNFEKCIDMKLFWIKYLNYKL